MEGSQAVPAQTKASATPVVESRDPSAEAAAISNEATGIGLKGRLQLAFGAITLFVVIAGTSEKAASSTRCASTPQGWTPARSRGAPPRGTAAS